MNGVVTEHDRRLLAIAGGLVAPYSVWEFGAPAHWPLLLQIAAVIAAVFAARCFQRRLQMLRRRRNHDPITGLPNRGHAAVTFKALNERHGGITLFCIAIQDLAGMRDALGPTAGDELLIEVGERLVAADAGTVARTGTNEFTLIRPRTGDDEAALIATRLLDLAHVEPFRAGDAAVVLDWSLGIASTDAARAEFEQTIGLADQARHRAVTRHAGFEIHRPERDDIGRARLGMLVDLREALDNGQLCVSYQPKARAADARVVGVEALVRWDHPVHGTIAPGAFLPLLQHTGLSRNLTLTVLRQAIDQVAEWRADGHDLTLAVNVTPRDLQDPDFPGAVASLLATRRTAAQWIQLEVTETAIVTDDARTNQTLHALANLGVKLAIDDFGAGATSLSWLRDLPVAEVKLDKNYVLKMGGSYVDSAIIRAVVDLAHKLRLSVVAEGVEDAMTWRELEHMGCDLIQGYHLCPPLPGPDLTAWLNRSNARTVVPTVRTSREGASVGTGIASRRRHGDSDSSSRPCLLAPSGGSRTSW